MMRLLGALALLAGAIPFVSAVVSVGDKLPSVELHSGFPPTKVDLAKYASGKSLVIVGLPGAFTPTCSTQQVPSYLEHRDALKADGGIDEVIVYCVNDGAVMSAWAKDQEVVGYEANDDTGMLTFLGDPDGSLTKSLGMELVHPGPIGVGIIGRCKRFAMFVVDGVVKAVKVSEAEDDPAGDDDPTETLAPAMLEAIKAANEIAAAKDDEL